MAEKIFWTAISTMVVLSIIHFGAGFFSARIKGAAKRQGRIHLAAVVLIVIFLMSGAVIAAQRGSLFLVVLLGIGILLGSSIAAGYHYGRYGFVQKGFWFWGVLAVVGFGLTTFKLKETVNLVEQLGVSSNAPKPEAPDVSKGCKESLEEVYRGFVHYAEVNDALPAAEGWMDKEDFLSHVQANEWLHCPTVSTRKDEKYGYAFNKALAGRKLNGKALSKMPNAAKTPLVFDSTLLEKSAADDMKSLPKPGRHNGVNHILYCDGHIEAVEPQ